MYIAFYIKGVNTCNCDLNLREEEKSLPRACMATEENNETSPFLKIGKLNNNMEIVHWTAVEICTIVVLSDQTSIPSLVTKLINITKHT